MLKYLFLLCIAIPLTALAVIYKSVDRDGNVIYTDEPSLNAEEIPEPSPNTVQMPKPRPVAPVDPVEATRYTSLLVTQPSANQILRSNLGLVTINIQLSPALDVKAGHTVNIMVDGHVLIRNSTRLSTQIPDINPGSHRVQAIVSNKQGAALIKSNDVSFIMQRQTFVNNKGADSPGPKNAPGNSVNPAP